MHMPYWEEPKYNDPEEVDGPGDVNLPATMHHMQARAEIDLLVRAGSLEEAEGEEAMKLWRAKGELDDESRELAAISVLEDRGLIEAEEAAELREKSTAT